MKLIFPVIVLSLLGLACADGPYSMLSPYVYKKIMSVKSVRHDIQRALGSDLNDIADQLVGKANQVLEARGMDPYDLPKVSQEHNLGLIIYDLDLTEGLFHGASSMERNGDVIATYDSKNKYLKMSQSIVLGEAVVNYNYEVTSGPLSNTGTVEDKIDSLSIHLEIGFSFKSFQFKLDDLAISDSGFDLQLRTDDLLIQLVLIMFADLYGAEWHENGRNNFEGAMKDMARDNINKINQYLTDFLKSKKTERKPLLKLPYY